MGFVKDFKKKSMIISVTNLKGGCGKTTLSTNLAVAFAKAGKSVCLIDTDLGQASALEWAGIRAEQTPHIQVMGKKLSQITTDANELAKNYDIVLIDGSPQLEELADRTILASDVIVIPTKPSLQDFRSTEEFLKRYQKVKELKKAAGSDVIAFTVLNEANIKTNIYKDIKSATKKLGVELLCTISDRISYRDAFAYGMGVVEYDDKKAKAEINDLAERILKSA